MIRQFINSQTRNAAIFMSGTGVNAAEMLKQKQKLNDNSWTPQVIICDRPKRSTAGELAKQYNIPLIEHDIFEFYHKYNQKVSIATTAGRKVRELWTAELREKIAPFNIDFGILAGFVPLSNITNDFPCLNIHPGDLTITENKQRILVGLHAIPIEKAILKGLDYLRSSVIVAQSYTDGSEMDSGPLLGVSAKVPLNLQGHTLIELQKIFADRKNIPGKKDDLLRQLAELNQTTLKFKGDVVVFYPAVRNFVLNRYGLDENEQLYFLNDQKEWQKITTIEYSENNYQIID